MPTLLEGSELLLGTTAFEEEAAVEASLEVLPPDDLDSDGVELVSSSDESPGA